MLVLRDFANASRIADPDLRHLVRLRLTQVCNGEAYDSQRHGQFIVVEEGDTVEQLEHVVGLPILHDLFTAAPYGDPDFSPCFDLMEEHYGSNSTFYELHVDTSDDGAGVTVFVPSTQGIDARLLALCEEYCTPTVATP